MNAVTLNFLGGPFDGGHKTFPREYYPDGKVIRVIRRKKTHQFWYDYSSTTPYLWGEESVDLLCVNVVAVTLKNGGGDWKK